MQGKDFLHGPQKIWGPGSGKKPGSKKRGPVLPCPVVRGGAGRGGDFAQGPTHPGANASYDCVFLALLVSELVAYFTLLGCIFGAQNTPKVSVWCEKHHGDRIKHSHDLKKNGWYC